MTSVQQAAITAATKPVALLAIAHHVEEHKLLAPTSIDLTGDRLVAWVDKFGSHRWVDSIAVDADTTTDLDSHSRYVLRTVEGRLPALGIRVKLRFLQARPSAVVPGLRVVEGGEE